RFAVVPYELGAVDFRIRRQRENPRIIWVSNLGEARKAATQISTPAPASVDSGIDQQPALNRLVSLEMELKSDITRLQWELALLFRRVTTAERGLTAIYQSRTWRMLVRAGGLLLNATKFLRGGRN